MAKEYQIRSQGGHIEFRNNLSVALNLYGSTWDKVSWSLEDGSRLILRSDGSWELWDEKSMLEMVKNMVDSDEAQSD